MLQNKGYNFIPIF